jgi:putative ABC transport system substrate-binding protein
VLVWQDSGIWHEVMLRGFVEGLRDDGFVPGQNVELLVRSADNDPRRFGALARLLAIEGVDLFFAPSTPMASAAWAASRRTPIVASNIMDPVRLGFAKSLARPGTRLTGVTTMNAELTGKRLELLGEMLPGLRRVGLLLDEAKAEACREEGDALRAAAREQGITLIARPAERREAIEPALRELLQEHAQALASMLLGTRNDLHPDFARAALKHRLPTLFETVEPVLAGGLFSYGPDFHELYRRAGRLAGRVLKGADPAETPIEEPSRFHLTLNLRTAREIGLAVPPAIRLRADEVIE